MLFFVNQYRSSILIHLNLMIPLLDEKLEVEWVSHPIPLSVLVSKVQKAVGRTIYPRDGKGLRRSCNLDVDSRNLGEPTLSAIPR